MQKKINSSIELDWNNSNFRNSFQKDKAIDKAELYIDPNNGGSY
jgi:hypothetical protein